MATSRTLQEISNFEDSDSSSDEDFNPDASFSVAESSAVEDDKNSTRRRKRKIEELGQDDEDLGELASGDEATIRIGKKQKRRKKGKRPTNADEEENDSPVFVSSLGQDVGVVRTRSMRTKEEQEHKFRLPSVSDKPVTVDIDSIYKQMVSKPLGRAESPLPPEEQDTKAHHTISDEVIPASSDLFREEYVTITRTYKFAGQTTTETKRVPKSSAEAQLWLKQQEEAEASGKGSGFVQAIEGRPPLRRPLRRPSRFDPTPSGQIKGLPPSVYSLKLASLHHGDTLTTFVPLLQASKSKAPVRLTVVEKSKLDWAEHVDEAGLQDELEARNKAKDAYISRMEFQNRVEWKREEELRKGRIAGL